MTKKTTVEKKPREPQKVSNFDNIANGVCPHCQEKTLADEVATKGVRVTRTCTKCQHTWSLNRKIHTCKCLTCAQAKQSKREA